VVGWFQRPRDVVTVLEWFLAAIVINDLVLLPLYSLLDRIAFARAGGRPDGPRAMTTLRPINATPYLRIPAILSGLLLLVFFPVIFGLGARTELAASGIAESGYLARWLVATGAIFALSGVAYAVAVARARASAQAAAPVSEQTIAGNDSAPSADLDPDHITPDNGSSRSGDPDPGLNASGTQSSETNDPDPDPSASGNGSSEVGDPDPDRGAPGDDTAPGPGPD
jgi:hypothetical protein